MAIRVDKWLWSVRIYKTRTLAIEAVKSGRVKLGTKVLKPSYQVKENDTLEVRKDGFFFRFKVLIAIEKRVGAPIAKTCFEDLTPLEEINKYAAWFAGESRDRGLGRPTKREGRAVTDFKDAYFDDDDDDEDDEIESLELPPSDDVDVKI
jgi:ribosome-associated heat shock protein Hsp15